MDFEEIEALVKTLQESPTLTELEVKRGVMGVRLRRPSPIAPGSVPPLTRSSSASSPSVKPQEAISGDTSAVVTITSPLVGVYRSRRGNRLEVGDQVSANELLGQIEAMRLLNDCVATTAGRIQAIFVEEGRPVEYGQPLFEISPEAIP